MRTVSGLSLQTNRELGTGKPVRSGPGRICPGPSEMTRQKTQKGSKVPHLCFSLSPKPISSSLQVPLLLPNLLKKTVQLSKFKDLIDFIQRFMKQVASHLANGKETQGAVENRRFFKAKKGGGKS